MSNRIQQRFPALADDAELVSDFVLEAREHIRRVEAQLLLLESNPGTGEALQVCFRAFHNIKALAGFLGFEVLQQFCHDTETLLDRARSGALAVTPETADLLLAAADFVSAEISAIERQAAPTDTGSTGNGEGLRVRVDTAKLDHLIQVIGELVIAESLVRNDPLLLDSDCPRLNRNLAQLYRITKELQKATLSIRLAPVGQLFGRVARLVRDLARRSGKVVELKMHGEEIELDRNIVEELADPLMHMVRNAIDHGIETPYERRIMGKPEIATITLAASNRDGHIVIEVSDDGRGLERNKIVAKAEQQGLSLPGATLSDQEVFALIFEAGLSTAERVTELSGRGVGMDVVRKQIHKLRGHIETQSKPGAGTTFTLHLPVTV